MISLYYIGCAKVLTRLEIVAIWTGADLEGIEISKFLPTYSHNGFCYSSSKESLLFIDLT
jgi:hypothetical protein